VWARQIDTKIVLVDGRTLARLMILHDVGCSPARTYVVKKLDSDYFVEEYYPGNRQSPPFDTMSVRMYTSRWCRCGPGRGCR